MDSHLEVWATNGMTEIPYYSDYAMWFFNNDFYKNFMRDSFVFIVLILLPASGYFLYRTYWWALSTDIWVPPQNN